MGITPLMEVTMDQLYWTFSTMAQVFAAGAAFLAAFMFYKLTDFQGHYLRATEVLSAMTQQEPIRGQLPPGQLLVWAQIEGGAGLLDRIRNLIHEEPSDAFGREVAAQLATAGNVVRQYQTRLDETKGRFHSALIATLVGILVCFAGMLLTRYVTDNCALLTIAVITIILTTSVLAAMYGYAVRKSLN